MRALAKILLPVDFSERSLGAARYAETLASHFRAELVLLHVLTPPHYEFGALEIGGSMLSELYVNRAAQVQKELESFPADAPPGLRITRLVQEGDPARSIVEYAHSQHADLIVMPTHGYGPFRRFILGSITAKVLHDADCPVWTGVHLEDAPRVETIAFQNIVCAVDLGPQSARALEWAAGLQQEFQSRLTVVHVNTCTQDPRGEQDDTEWRTQLQRAAREEAHRLMHRVGVQGELLIESGDPAREVCGTAERLRADLLVIGRGSAGGVFGRLRTNAYAIIRQSPCPVVSV
jgi:nucleotide-binding universal stress UspA family protein